MIAQEHNIYYEKKDSKESYIINEVILTYKGINYIILHIKIKGEIEGCIVVNVVPN